MQENIENHFIREKLVQWRCMLVPAAQSDCTISLNVDAQLSNYSEVTTASF